MDRRTRKRSKGVEISRQQEDEGRQEMVIKRQEEIWKYGIQSLRGIAKETVSPSMTKGERGSEYGEAGREWKAERRTWHLYRGFSALHREEPFQEKDLMHATACCIRRGWIASAESVYINFSKFFFNSPKVFRSLSQREFNT